ncbi:MAG: hypothetical protein KGY51_07965 [Psychroflexus sp.]|uniref:Peptidylprolyl isomerase n=2 Tax=Mesohalobacter halotolerans TaxID=1883405 RepID=A0A4U5TQK8_9FLAO|nr:hypothetical protein [Psychroflexus sp.]TKS55738.1 hypothetical protein FCN74_10560 [Mesohalobacter halotolerans]
MKLMKFFVVLFVFLGLLSSCSSDDDGGGNAVELRDPEEVKIENQAEIEAFLETHFFEFVDNPQNQNFQKFTFDTIAGENSDKTPIMESDLLASKQVIQQDVEYTLYYLIQREGNPQERKPTFADSTLVTFEGITIDNETFDFNPNPVWFDLPQTVRGFYELLPELRGSSGFVENGDGTVTFNDDFGIGVVFVPSGLGFFATPPIGSSIKRYQPIIFAVQLYKSKEADHDQDGIPSFMEDMNGNRRVDDIAEGDDTGDDTDRDGLPNYLDRDDDNDSVLTIDEIIINEEDGSIEFPDSNGNGTPDYLDDTFPEDDNS